MSGTALAAHPPAPPTSTCSGTTAGGIAYDSFFREDEAVTKFSFSCNVPFTEVLVHTSHNIPGYDMTSPVKGWTSCEFTGDSQGFLCGFAAAPIDSAAGWVETGPGGGCPRGIAVIVAVLFGDGTEGGPYKLRTCAPTPPPAGRGRADKRHAGKKPPAKRRHRCRGSRRRNRCVR